MVLLGLLELIDGKTAQQAVDLPRFHHQYLPDEISMEAGALDAETIAALEAKGHVVKALDRTWGNMQVVSWDLTTGAVAAGTDPRWEGVGKGALGENAEAGDKSAIFR
jgi:gamma-glutamyltranspeptidase/glutathione hydrolase